MGVVYRAHDRNLDRDVALKVLPPGGLEDEPSRRRFRREALALSRVSHPHIETVHDFGTSEGVDYLVTELVPGESLAQRLELGPVPEAECLALGRQVALGLEAAHARGVVHRDLKPGNIMVTPEGQAKLVDFGLAKLLRGAEVTASTATALTTEPGWVMGTLSYMAPEQVAGGAVDGRTDLYALGAVLYEMATGRPPFHERQASALVYLIVSQAPPPPRAFNPAVSLEFERLVLRCLEKDPARRFPSAAGLAEALARPAETAPSPPPGTRLRAIGLAAAVLLAAVLAITLLPRRAALAPQRVAVAGFDNATGRPELDPIGRMAADWITQGISRTGIVDVVPSGQVIQSARSLEDAGGRRGEDLVRLLAEDTGAALVVSGTYYLEGDTLRFQARLVNVHRGGLLHALDPVAGSRTAPLQLIETLRQRVMATLASQLNPRLASWAAVSSRPPSFEAYQAYVEGQEHFIRREWRAAIELFHRAAARDSTYTYPLLEACLAHLNLGEPAKIDSITRILSRSAEQLAPLDRRVLEWLRAGLRGDLEAGYRTAREAAELAPISLWSYQRALQALLLNRPREVIEVLATLDPERGPMRGWTPYWNLLTDGHHQLGAHASELLAARQSLRQYPDQTLPRVLELRALAALGRTGEVLEGCETLLAMSPTPGDSPARLLVGIARELRTHGHAAAADRVLERVLAWQRAEDSADPSRPGDRAMLAGTLYHLGRYAEARSQYRHLVAVDSASLTALGFLGATSARLGDRAGAEAAMVRLASLPDPYLRGANTYSQAEIAALLGERSRALALLRRALREGQPIAVRAHSDPDFDALRGDPEFQRLVSPRR